MDKDGVSRVEREARMDCGFSTTEFILGIVERILSPTEVYSFESSATIACAELYKPCGMYERFFVTSGTSTLRVEASANVMIRARAKEPTVFSELKYAGVFLGTLGAVRRSTEDVKASSDFLP